MQRVGQRRPTEGVTEDSSGFPFAEETKMGQWRPLDISRSDSVRTFSRLLEPALDCF